MAKSTDLRGIELTRAATALIALVGEHRIQEVESAASEDTLAFQYRPTMGLWWRVNWYMPSVRCTLTKNDSGVTALMSVRLNWTLLILAIVCTCSGAGIPVAILGWAVFAASMLWQRRRLPKLLLELENALGLARVEEPIPKAAVPESLTTNSGKAGIMGR